ncbi:MAG: rhodanese-like domain-containing protein [Candidatus Bathyarchaeia archaeon]
MSKRAVAFLGVLLLSALLAPFSIKTAHSTPPRAIPPIVTTDWLNAHLGTAGLVVLDIRGPEEYNASHIPGAINVPSYLWYTNPPFGAEVPWMEMPPEDYLFELLGNNSITEDSLVVVVGSTSGILTPVPLALYNIATVTRVAMTLLYAGVENVAILDGGFDKWVADGYSTESGTVTPTPVTYSGTVKSDMLVDKEYVASKIGEAIIIDARDLEVYLGFIQEPWCARVGHIPTARSFPTPWLWDLNINATDGTVIYGTYKNTGILKAFAECIVGTNKSMEIIVYCGVGGYASTMYFVLSEVLNYTNVKFYDGSAQEWTSDLTLPVVYEDLGYDFMQLQDDYSQLQSNYEDLQNSYAQLQNNVTQLQNTITQLQNSIAQLQNSYNQLQSEYADLKAKCNELANLTYIFVATTVIFVISTVYLATKIRKKAK